MRSAGFLASGGGVGAAEQIKADRHRLGLDQPVAVRYWKWARNFLSGDLGTSTSSEEPVSAIIRSRVGNTLTLAAFALVLSLPLALLLGVLAGKSEGRLADQVISTAALAFVSIPFFVTGALLVLVFAFAIKLLPPVSLLPAGQPALHSPKLLVLPGVTLALGLTAYLTRFVRASVADVLRSRYIEMSRLNGISERRVILRHLLPNALAPSVQVLAAATGFLVGGAVLVETVFAFPGLGLALVSAVNTRDVFTVQSIGTLVAAMVIVAYIIADVLLILLIPKLRTAA